jgi:2-oxoisovalerate dehydrogenase E1 component beta subunit
LKEEGVDTEVIDLRTLQPFDREAIVESVKKTNKVIILHEATRTGGMAGELTAVINEEAFEYLDGPVMRVTSIDTPVPYAPPLEEYFMPQVDDVLKAARTLVAY